MRYLEDESDDFLSEDDDSDDKDQPFSITENMTKIEEIDEEARTIIVKRVNDKEINFTSLSLGDDFIETFCDKL